MSQTKISNLVNPQVMADMISAELPNKIRFAPLASIDLSLVDQPGNTITIPKFAYIGDAEDVAEGVAMGTVLLQSSTSQATVKKAGKALELTDESILSGYGDPVGEANAQLLKSITAKIDNDCVEALNDAVLEHDVEEVINYNAIVDAVDKFEDEDDEVKVLFIHSQQRGTLRKDEDFIDNVTDMFMTGVIGEVAGCHVVVSNKVPKNEDGTYTNFIVKPGALAIYLKRDVLVEDARDILKKTTVISADEHYAVALADDSKVVKLTVKQ